MQTVNNIQKARELVEFAGKDGKIFTIKFLKKDGTVRTMNARLNVSKYTKGGTRSTYNNPNIIGLYDMELRKTLSEEDGSKAYRSMRLGNIISINGRKVNMKVS